MDDLFRRLEIVKAEMDNETACIYTFHGHQVAHSQTIPYQLFVIEGKQRAEPGTHIEIDFCRLKISVEIDISFFERMVKKPATLFYYRLAKPVPRKGILSLFCIIDYIGISKHRFVVNESMSQYLRNDFGRHILYNIVTKSPVTGEINVWHI
jgi:hypothetical protein